ICILAFMFHVSMYFFFFQAEDGIRDRNVTGVQTCALPISVRQALHDERQEGLADGRVALGVGFLEGVDDAVPERQRIAEVLERRSEERRVGKECRARGRADQYKKKKYVRKEEHISN